MSLGKRAHRCALWLTLLASTTLALGSVFAAPGTDSGTETDRTAAVQRGVSLERSRQWLEAIEHYERESKHFPDSRELEYGLRRAKIHYGIERRYADSSFQRTMLPLSRREALDLLDEVLNKIQAHYVETLSSTSFVAHGTESLYLALADQKYMQRNLPDADPERVQKVRRILRESYWNKPIANRVAVRDTVNEVCNLTSTELSLPAGAVVMEYLFGGCNALDDYSSYLTPSRLNDLYGNIEGQFVGLGIEMKAETGKGLLLVNVLPDSPAAVGGLMSGEHIVSIDGVDCRNMTTDEAASLLQGVENSRVNLQITGQDDSTRSGVFIRRAVNVKSIPVAKIIDRENGIGYIQMTGFQKSSSAEMDAALAQLRQEGMRALIWDVRGNPGGLLTAAVEVLDRFIPDGVLVSTKGRTSDQNWSYTAHRSGTLDMPLVLLTDGDSASASEIVAGAIRDHHRGTIVGRKTYGKWSVQSIFPVRGSAGLRLTTAKFYSPNGHTLGKVGVQPDVVVNEPAKHRTFFRAPTDVNMDDDSDLLKGLEVLRGQMARR
ncbi:MAG TPA: S41 family peptidase [Planctomycetaceae bacterium]|nr:S41 family peptidase [Planctomycetaceae bacterium]